MKPTLILAAALSLAATAALAEVSKPECVAPAQPGGGFDLTCRVAQMGMARDLPRPMEVTFMPGGIGAVAFNAFNAARKGDQNAIVAFSTGSLLNLAVGKYGKYSADDARWVGAAGVDYGAVIVKADSPFKTLGDLVEALKKDPAALVMGAGGTVGSQDWMKAALVAKAAGADPKALRYVAFDGGGEAMAGLLGGAIQVYTGDVAEMTAHMDGSVRILGVMAEQRLPAPFDQTPTAREQGVDAVWPILRGYYVGKDVGDADYDQWVQWFQAAYQSPEFQKVQQAKGLFPLPKAGEAFDAAVREQITTLTAMARDAGLIAR